MLRVLGFGTQGTKAVSPSRYPKLSAQFGGLPGYWKCGSVNGVAAVDHDDRSGHERRGVGGHVDHGRGDLLRQRETLHGSVLDPVPVEFRLVDRSHFGLDVTG